MPRTSGSLRTSRPSTAAAEPAGSAGAPNMKDDASARRLAGLRRSVLTLALGALSACVPAAGGDGAGSNASGGAGGPVSGTGGKSAAGSGGGGTAPGATGGTTGAGGSGGGSSTEGGASGSSAGGTGGSAGGGSTGSGGSPVPSPDTMPPTEAGGSSGGDVAPEAAPSIDVAPPPFPPIAACAKPAVDNLQQWIAWSGTTTPPTNSNALTKEGDKNVAKITFSGCATWCQWVVPIANSLTAQVDLTKSLGFSMTYSSTGDVWAQARPASLYHGGAHWVMKIPSTGGEVQTHFFPFVPEAWIALNRLGKPTYPFPNALKDLRSLVFVTQMPAQITVRGMRFDGYTPTCR